MVIGIDGNEANVDKKVGVSVYTTNLLYYWRKKANPELKFKVFLRKKPLSDLPQANEHLSYEVVIGERLWSQIFLPARLHLKRDIDVFFTPAHYAPRLCPVPVVVTIHDLSYFYYPEEFLKKDLYKLENWTKYSVQKANKIIAVSQNTKKDLSKFYIVPDNKVKVIYNGYEKLSQNLDLRIKNYELNSNLKFKIEPSKYILYVGTLQPRKNVPILIRAFNKFRQNNSKFKLVIVGRKGWLYREIFELVEQLEIENDVVFTDYVPDAKLVELYRNAFCFVLPSLYEGFGIPVLEAMSYDCPVISSNASSLPEIGGNACLYFNPENERELLKKLIDLKESKTLRSDLIRKGEEQIKKFSWQKCADETLEVIKSVSTSS